MTGWPITIASQVAVSIAFLQVQQVLCKIFRNVTVTWEGNLLHLKI